MKPVLVTTAHLANHFWRKAQYLFGRHFPDARDQELRDRGVELQWRLAVRRRELERRDRVAQEQLPAFLRPQAI